MAARGHGEDSLPFLVHERDAVVRKQPREIAQQPPRHDDRSVSGHVTLERRAQRDLHVGRGERELPVLGLEVDAAQDLDRTARRDAAGHDAERLCEVAPRARGPQLGGDRHVCVHY